MWHYDGSMWCDSVHHFWVQCGRWGVQSQQCLTLQRGTWRGLGTYLASGCDWFSSVRGTYPKSSIQGTPLWGTISFWVWHLWQPTLHLWGEVCFWEHISATPDLGLQVHLYTPAKHGFYIDLGYLKRFLFIDFIWKSLAAKLILTLRKRTSHKHHSEHVCFFSILSIIWWVYSESFIRSQLCTSHMPQNC